MSHRVATRVAQSLRNLSPSGGILHVIFGFMCRTSLCHAGSHMLSVYCLALSRYRVWAHHTPFTARSTMVGIVVAYFVSWFLPQLNYALSNSAHYTIQEFEGQQSTAGAVGMQSSEFVVVVTKWG